MCIFINSSFSASNSHRLTSYCASCLEKIFHSKSHFFPNASRWASPAKLHLSLVFLFSCGGKGSRNGRKKVQLLAGRSRIWLLLFLASPALPCSERSRKKPSSENGEQRALQDGGLHQNEHNKRDNVHVMLLSNRQKNRRHTAKVHLKTLSTLRRVTNACRAVKLVHVTLGQVRGWPLSAHEVKAYRHCC